MCRTDDASTALDPTERGAGSTAIYADQGWPDEPSDPDPDAGGPEACPYDRVRDLYE